LLGRHGTGGGLGGGFHGDAFNRGLGFGNVVRVANWGGSCQEFLRYFLRLGWNQAAMAAACQGWMGRY
jgi:hypothetical protein